jgi:hypothetical protein
MGRENLRRRTPIRPATLVAIAVAAAVATATSPASDAKQSRVARPAAARFAAVTTPELTIGKAPTGQAIPSGFLGLSLEYKAIEGYAGTNPQAINPVLVQLIRNLSPNQAPVLRIGGGSTDHTWWPVAGFRQPPGVNYVLTKTWLAVTAVLARALDARLTLGINLEENSNRLASAEAKAMLAGIGSRYVRAWEPGNEPELYASWGWYVRHGRSVPGRPRGYNFAAFTREFSHLAAALPRVPMAGPTVGGAKWIKGDLDRFISSEPRLGVVTVHRYPLISCFQTPASPKFPTIGHLLSSASSTDLADTLTSSVATAHAHHLALRVDEINTVSCGATFGVGNAFASGLWALDMMFELARVGVDGVNIHTFPGSFSAPFTFTHTGTTWSAAVEPEYYGMLMFAQAAPPGSQLLPVSGTAGQSLVSWATHGRDGHVRVVLINKSSRGSTQVAIKVPGAVGAASIESLQAPSLKASSGVTLAGQSFGASTNTGLLTGPSTAVSVPQTGSDYVVRVPAASAALLTIS